MVVRLPNNEPQRLARIHNTKWLHMGIDLAALEAQMKARHQAQELEAQVQREAAVLEAAHNLIAHKVQCQEQQARDKALKDLQEFRSCNQGLQKGRDWDLSRPDQKKVDVPARLGDADPRCGPASLQQLDGEDLSLPARQHADHLRNRQLWDAQSQARDQRLKAEAAEERLMAAKIKAMDEQQLELKLQELRQSREASLATKVFNQELSQRHKAAQAAQAAEEQEAKKRHIEAVLGSCFLNECLPTTEATDSSRKPVTEFKGMSEKMRKAAEDGLREQLLREAALKAAQAEEEKMSWHSQAATSAQLHKDLIEAALAKKQQDAELGRFLQSQHDAKQQKDQALRSLYANAVGPEYFSQFETSHR